MLHRGFGKEMKNLVKENKQFMKLVKIFRQNNEHIEPSHELSGVINNSRHLRSKNNQSAKE